MLIKSFLLSWCIYFSCILMVTIIFCQLKMAKKWTYKQFESVFCPIFPCFRSLLLIFLLYHHYNFFSRIIYKRCFCSNSFDSGSIFFSALTIKHLAYACMYRRKERRSKKNFCFIDSVSIESNIDKWAIFQIFWTRRELYSNPNFNIFSN